MKIMRLIMIKDFIRLNIYIYIYSMYSIYKYNNMCGPHSVVYFLINYFFNKTVNM